MTTVLDTWTPRADAVPEPAPQPEPWSPAEPYPPEPQGPRVEVDRVDALDCEGPAAHRVGLRYVCQIHYWEVLTAYWECDSSLVLQHLTESGGHHCGDVEEAPR